MQEAGVQAWLQSAVAQLRHDIDHERRLHKKNAVQQEQAMLDVRVNILISRSILHVHASMLHQVAVHVQERGAGENDMLQNNPAAWS